MNDFTAEELFEAIDRSVRDLLELVHLEEPPVDALALAEGVFRLPIREVEPDDESGSRRPVRKSREILLRFDQSPEARQVLGARGCAREMLPQLLAKLGVVPGTENRGADTQLINAIVPRLLLPARWFSGDARKAGYDLFTLKERYPLTGFEMLAQRLLDLDEPCIVAVVDDGVVASRRSNLMPATKKLLPAEERCRSLVEQEGEPQKVRSDGWTVTGWPIPTGPFNRIILRSVSDDI